MTLRKELFIRMLLFLLVGFLAAGLISELTFRLQKNTSLRGPQIVQLVIPPGSARKVAKGESVLPDQQTFVVGDTLQVKNDDSVTQTFGPLVIPPGSSASMKLDQLGNVKYTCSFQPDKVYGITVIQGLSTGMRVQAILMIGLPLGVLLGVYSLIIKPLRKASPIER